MTNAHPPTSARRRPERSGPPRARGTRCVRSRSCRTGHLTSLYANGCSMRSTDITVRGTCSYLAMGATEPPPPRNERPSRRRDRVRPAGRRATAICCERVVDRRTAADRSPVRRRHVVGYGRDFVRDSSVPRLSPRDRHPAAKAALLRVHVRAVMLTVPALIFHGAAVRQLHLSATTLSATEGVESV
jgi:hypothetical protein